MSSVLKQATIDEIAAEVDDDLIGVRHDIQRHPELAGDERRASALAAERRPATGMAVATAVARAVLDAARARRNAGGGHGVVATFGGTTTTRAER